MSNFSVILTRKPIISFPLEFLLTEGGILQGESFTSSSQNLVLGILQGESFISSSQNLVLAGILSALKQLKLKKNLVT